MNARICSVCGEPESEDRPFYPRSCQHTDPCHRNYMTQKQIECRQRKVAKDYEGYRRASREYANNYNRLHPGRNSKYYPPIPDLEGEIWKPVPGFEKQYEISNYGRVVRIRYKGKKLLNLKKRGYWGCNVNFSTPHRKWNVLIHQAVALVFIGDPEGRDVSHINGDLSDNRVDNLEYVHNRGERRPTSKLKEVDIPCIKALYENGMTQNDIAKQYKVTSATIWLVVHNKTWKYIEQEINRVDQRTG